MQKKRMFLGAFILLFGFASFLPLLGGSDDEEDPTGTMVVHDGDAAEEAEPRDGDDAEEAEPHVGDAASRARASKARACRALLTAYCGPTDWKPVLKKLRDEFHKTPRPRRRQPRGRLGGLFENNEEFLGLQQAVEELLALDSVQEIIARNPDDKVPPSSVTNANNQIHWQLDSISFFIGFCAPLVAYGAFRGAQALWKAWKKVRKQAAVLKELKQKAMEEEKLAQESTSQNNADSLVPTPYWVND